MSKVKYDKEAAVKKIREIQAELDFSEPSAEEYAADLEYAITQLDSGVDPNEVMENV